MLILFNKFQFVWQTYIQHCLQQSCLHGSHPGGFLTQQNKQTKIYLTIKKSLSQVISPCSDLDSGWSYNSDLLSKNGLKGGLENDPGILMECLAASFESFSSLFKQIGQQVHNSDSRKEPLEYTPDQPPPLSIPTSQARKVKLQWSVTTKHGWKSKRQQSWWLWQGDTAVLSLLQVRPWVHCVWITTFLSSCMCREASITQR